MKLFRKNTTVDQPDMIAFQTKSDPSEPSEMLFGEVTYVRQGTPVAKITEQANKLIYILFADRTYVHTNESREVVKKKLKLITGKELME